MRRLRAVLPAACGGCGPVFVCCVRLRMRARPLPHPHMQIKHAVASYTGVPVACMFLSGVEEASARGSADGSTVEQLDWFGRRDAIKLQLVPADVDETCAEFWR